MEPKQELHICKYCGAETIQSDSECYAKSTQESIEDASSIYVDSIRNRIDGYCYLNVQEGFQKGAEWMQEKIPSIINDYLESAFISIEKGYKNPEQWFEKYKKK